MKSDVFPFALDTLLHGRGVHYLLLLLEVRTHMNNYCYPWERRPDCSGSWLECISVRAKKILVAIVVAWHCEYNPHAVSWCCKKMQNFLGNKQINKISRLATTYHESTTTSSGSLIQTLNWLNIIYIFLLLCLNRNQFVTIISHYYLLMVQLFVLSVTMFGRLAVKVKTDEKYFKLYLFLKT